MLSLTGVLADDGGFLRIALGLLLMSYLLPWIIRARRTKLSKVLEVDKRESGGGFV